MNPKLCQIKVKVVVNTTQGHSTNHFAKMYFSTQINKNKSLLRHFQVFLNVAGKKLSVPFCQQTVHRKFPSQENIFFIFASKQNELNFN